MLQHFQMRVCLALLCLLSACGPNQLQNQARIANAFALAGNAALPVLVDAYQHEGVTAILAAADRDAAERALEAVRVRWRPLWGADALGQDCASVVGAECHGGAWPALRAAEAAWADELEREMAGRPMDPAVVQRLGDDLRSAYCELRAAIPAGVTIPQLPLLTPCSSSGGASP